MVLLSEHEVPEVFLKWEVDLWVYYLLSVPLCIYLQWKHLMHNILNLDVMQII